MDLPSGPRRRGTGSYLRDVARSCAQGLCERLVPPPSSSPVPVPYLRVFLSVSLLAATAGCGGGGEEKNVRDASKALAASLAAETTPAPSSKAGGTGGNGVRIYVDATRSMAGFVGCSERLSAFDKVLARMASDLSVSQVVLFGEPSMPGKSLYDERPLDRSVQCPDQYSRLQNPDFKLIERISADSAAGLNVYLTDGVQSAMSAATPSPSVRALQQWVSGGHALAILAFRGDFDGPGWSERLGRWIGNASVPDRPFYAFLFTRNEEEMDRALARLSPELTRGATLIRLRGGAAACRVEPQVLASTGTSNPLWLLMTAAAQDSLAARPGVIANYSCRIGPSYPVRAVPARIEATHRPWLGNAFGDAQTLPPGVAFSADTATATQEGSIAPVWASIPDVASTRFGFYHLVLHGQPGEIKPSLLALSTDDDADPASFDRTYRFSWLLGHLVRAQFEQEKPRTPFFFTATYR